MNARECTTDLAERQRRARFSSAEQRALEAHLSVCSPCRTARQLLSDFQHLDTVDPQDGARIERLAALARSRVARPAVAAFAAARQVKRVRVLGIAASLALLVGSALASARVWSARHEPTRAVLAATSGTPNALRFAPTPPLPSLPPAQSGATTPHTVSTESRVSPAALTPSVRSAPADSGAARAPDVLTAAVLLRQAGDTLRRGDRDAAALLYQKLQAQYPDSAEALVSHVSLGRLLAERGQPRAAVREFDRYLSGSRAGVLVPEALYGRARALTGLGDHGEEQRTWQRLLHDFPDSTYADPARRRLAELE